MSTDDGKQQAGEQTQPLVDSAAANMNGESEASSNGTSPDSELSSDGGEAPLAIADGDDISIDGTSVAGSEASTSSRPESIEQVTEDDKAAALRLKSVANSHFGKAEYQQALDLYTASLNINPFDAVYVL